LAYLNEEMEDAWAEARAEQAYLEQLRIESEEQQYYIFYWSPQGWIDRFYNTFKNKYEQA